MNGRPHSDIEAVRGQWRTEDRERQRGPSPGCEGEMTAPPVQPGAAPWSPDVVCNYVQRAGSVHLSFSPVNEVVDISILLQSLS